MADIPDLSEMSPDRWLSKMQEIREELLGEFVRVLNTCEEAESAAEAFAGVFQEYALPNDGDPGSPMLSVRTEDGVLIFERESTGDERELTRTDDGHWVRIEAEEAEAAGDEEAYRELATEVLQLLPWWSDGAFAAKVGNPEAFVDRSESSD